MTDKYEIGKDLEGSSYLLIGKDLEGSSYLLRYCPGIWRELGELQKSQNGPCLGSDSD
jgi:hypothetical protein